ncbi:MAG: hypothetical protein ABI134_06480 [Byssovorax sp.]
MTIRSILALTFALLLAGCGSSAIPLINGPQTPAAQGHIHTDVGDNGNLKLDIEVKHLAPPSNVSAGAKIYAVWIQANDAAPQNVGALKIGDDLTGRLQTVTPQHNFALFITTEVDPAVTAPQGARVLSATVTK